MLRHLILFATISYASLLTSSAQVLTIMDFNLIGDTYLTQNNCFRLTEAIDYSSGSVWYKYPVDLSQPLTIELSIRVGCEDESGADGMVFVMTDQNNQLGYVGEGIGFAGMVPSIGIEIDTWRNYHLNDPAEDHIAIMANGRVGHRSDLAGPLVIPNIEDCLLHSFVMKWDNISQELSIEIDQQEVIAVQADLVNSVFRGNPKVHWGVTAATGRYNNIHEICFNQISMLEPAHQIPYRTEGLAHTDVVGAKNCSCE